MGSVMKRSASGAKMGMSGTGAGMGSDENMNRRMRNRHSVVHEEMGDEWERVDIQKEVTEGDSSITRPFNVEVSCPPLSLSMCELTISTTYTYHPTSIIYLQHG
jgi:hypothetical protein